MVIIYIVLITSLICIIWHIFHHLMVVFYKYITDLYVIKVMEDPYRYIREEEMRYFFRNMVYLFLVSILLIAACNGNMKFEEKTNSVEINNMKK